MTHVLKNNVKTYILRKVVKTLKYGSEEKGSSLHKCSILKKLRSELLSEDKITNLLGFLTKKKTQKDRAFIE